MPSSKQNVVVGSHIIIVHNHSAVYDKFIFGRDKLIIFNEQNNSSDFTNISLLKLYPEEIKEIYLINFHFSNNHAFFIF